MRRPRRRVRTGDSESRDNRGLLGADTTSPIGVEIARANDLEALYRIEKECFTSEAFSKELVAFLLQRPDSTSLLAKVGGEVVGFVIAMTHEKGSDRISHILTVDVAPKARKRGVGSRLLRELENKVAENGVVACWLEVDVENLPARRLYGRMGYAEVGVIESYYRSGRDCVTMTKNLR